MLWGKRDKYGEVSNVIKENNENVKRKNPTKAQTITFESSKAKTTIIHPRQKKKKKIRKQKMVENNSRLLLTEKFDFDLEEIWDKLLLFDLKKKQVQINIWFSTWKNTRKERYLLCQT